MKSLPVISIVASLALWSSGCDARSGSGGSRNGKGDDAKAGTAAPDAALGGSETGSSTGEDTNTVDPSDAVPSVSLPENTNDRCSDNMDNDLDGYTDCVDFSCSKNIAVTVCSGSGDTGCPSVNGACSAAAPCCPGLACNAGTCATQPEDNDARCQDGLDNDQDGYTDCVDFTCSKSAIVTVCGNGATGGDCGAIGSDCASATPCCVGFVCAAGKCSDQPEDTNATCTDGADNDADGYTDCVDFDCSKNASVSVCGANPTCPGIGKVCTGSTPCCTGLTCYEGLCTACSGEKPKYCAEAGGGCWKASSVCSTVKKCSNGTKSCASADLTVDCESNKCLCPTDKPNYCVASGSLPVGCWPANIDCSTRTLCGSVVKACQAGASMDCATGACISLVPQWLVGTYSRFGKTENNIWFESDKRIIKFNADGSYSETIGKSASSEGVFKVSGNTLTFIDGPLGGSSLALNKAFDSTCHILYGYDAPLWRSDEVPQCPTFASVSAADCALVGTWSTSSTSGGFGSSGNGTQSTYSQSVQLYRDGFYTYDSSHSSTTCFGDNCKSLYSSDATKVGQWNGTTGPGVVSLSTLESWDFEKSDVACPVPPF